MFSSTNPLEIEARLNFDLHAFDNWVKQWLVDINKKKNLNISLIHFAKT